jgi:RNA polymerase sigma-70 factor (ECF subfamily)
VDADRPLVDAAAAGSREAFDELICRHQAAILNVIRALLGGAADSDDVAQETFVRAWKGLRRFRGDSSFRTWLYRVALNVARTELARQRHARHSFRPADERREPESGDEPIDRILGRRQAVERALHALPEDLRAAVTLRDLQGLEYRAIAEILEVPIGTVESRIFRARQRLRPLLEEWTSGAL